MAKGTKKVWTEQDVDFTREYLTNRGDTIVAKGHLAVERAAQALPEPDGMPEWMDTHLTEEGKRKLLNALRVRKSRVKATDTVQQTSHDPLDEEALTSFLDMVMDKVAGDKRLPSFLDGMDSLGKLSFLASVGLDRMQKEIDAL
jgi:hypothetical protein